MATEFSVKSECFKMKPEFECGFWIEVSWSLRPWWKFHFCSRLLSVWRQHALHSTLRRDL